MQSISAWRCVADRLLYTLRAARLAPVLQDRLVDAGREPVVQ